MSASPAHAPVPWTPFSPVDPSPDPEHEQRTVLAVARALRDIPFYQKRGHSPDTPLSRLPLLLKKDVRATLPKQWVPAGRDTRAELESGALELVETSGSTGDRLRILWDEGWWMRQEARAMKTHAGVRALMNGARGEYREAILTTPACGLGVCHVGDVPFEERLDGAHLFVNQRPDPLYWTDAEQTRILDELARHRTVGLESDPFYLSLLARFARAHARTIDVTGFIQLTYAFATRAFVRTIRQAFAGTLLQLYGASEVGVLFMEGEDARLHHCPFTTHVELLPARVPTPGAEDVALVVVTSLDRVAMPLVRFVVGDLVQVAHPPARAAGADGTVDRAGPRAWTPVPPIASVEGRVDDAVLRPDGALVTAGALDRAIGAPDGLRVWQVNQKTPDSVEIDVVADAGADAVVSGVRDRVAPLLEGMRVETRAVTGIPLEASGKLRVAKRHLPLNLEEVF